MRLYGMTRYQTKNVLVKYVCAREVSLNQIKDPNLISDIVGRRRDCFTLLYFRYYEVKSLRL